jgi:glycerol-3-phosphate acyltransferase PlsY
MDPVVILIILIGYLFGSISFAALLARIFAPGKDLSRTEVTFANGVTVVLTNVSALTLSHRVSKRLGMVCTLLDMTKAFVPTLAVKLRYPNTTYYLLIAVAVVVGHNWPVFNRFRGGRGFSPIYGGLLVIDWTSIVVSLLVSSLFTLVIPQIAIGFFTALVAVIPWLWLRTQRLEFVLYAVAVNVLYLASTIPEVKMYREWMQSGKDLSVAKNMTALDVMPYGDRVRQFLARV